LPLEKLRLYGQIEDYGINMAEEKIKETRLSPQEIEEFKAMLLVKQYEILSNVVSMEDETLRKENSNLSNMPIHMADIGTDNFDLENTLNLMESERKILTEIGDAIARMTYLEAKYDRDAARLALERADLVLQRQEALIEQYRIVCEDRADGEAAEEAARRIDRAHGRYRKAHCAVLNEGQPGRCAPPGRFPAPPR